MSQSFLVRKEKATSHLAFLNLMAIKMMVMHEYNITQHLMKALTFYEMLFLLVLPPACQIISQNRGQNSATSLLAANQGVSLDCVPIGLSQFMDPACHMLLCANIAHNSYVNASP